MFCSTLKSAGRLQEPNKTNNCEYKGKKHRTGRGVVWFGGQPARLLLEDITRTKGRQRGCRPLVFTLPPSFYTNFSGTGNASQSATTSALRAAFFSVSSLARIVAIIISASFVASLSFIPRVVMAGVPKRIPDGSIAVRDSSAIIFLLRVMPTSSSTVSASCPVIPSEP